MLHDFGYDALGFLGRLARFWRQFRKYGRGERILLAKHPGYPALFAGSREIPSIPLGKVPSIPGGRPQGVGVGARS